MSQSPDDHPRGYPVTLSLRHVPVLVVGGGPVAQGRCAGLLAVGARVLLVAPRVEPAIDGWAREGRLELALREFRPADLLGRRLVFTAVDDSEASRAIVTAARAAGLWVNAADITDLCDFTLPSVGRQGPISVAVATDGHAPALAALLRRQLTAQVSARHARLARLCRYLRSRRRAGPARMALLKRVVDGDVGRKLVAGERRAAFEALRGLLNHPESSP